MSWPAVVGFISMGVTGASALVTMVFGAVCVRRAYRDQQQAQQNRSER